MAPSLTTMPLIPLTALLLTVQIVVPGVAGPRLRGRAAALGLAAVVGPAVAVPAAAAGTAGSVTRNTAATPAAVRAITVLAPLRRSARVRLGVPGNACT